MILQLVGVVLSVGALVMLAAIAKRLHRDIFKLSSKR